MIRTAYRRCLTPLMRGIYRVDVRGAVHVPLGGPVVVAANHESLLDPFLLAAAIPRPIRFLAKAELWGVPLLHYVLDELEAIPVERGRSDVGAVASAVAALEAGAIVGIFPQGGVRREGPWLRGAARIALAAGAPLLPVRLLGTRTALGPGTIGFPPLAVLIGEPLEVTRAVPTIEHARAVTAQLQAAVEALGP